MAQPPRVALLMIPFAGYDRGLLRGIARYTQLHGPWVFYLSGDYPTIPLPESDSSSVKIAETMPPGTARGRLPLPSLRRWGATGVIGRIQSARMARTLLASKLPLIAIDLSDQQRAEGNPLSGISEIRADSHAAGRVAAEHYLDRGFRNFAFCGYEGRVWSRCRREGFCARLEQSGFTCDVYSPASRRSVLPWNREQPMVTSWLKSLAKPVAIMACNDSRGRQILEASLLAGLSVPDDVAVIGVDEDPLLCSLANPPLSSVAFNLEQAGYQAAELLDGLMSGRVESPRQIMVEALWVIPRRSTDVIAIEDRNVAAALRFIRDHARQPISVADVVRQALVSRRGLEIRFQHSLGRSIREEVQRVRLGWTKQLLVETNLPAWRIAEASGFSSLSYLSNVFRRELGMTLAQYRRRLRSP